MIILTKAIKEKLIANHKHHKEYWNDEHPKYKEFKAVLKLFNPTGIGTWYLSELDPETNIAFGLCCLTEKELGYVNLDELLGFKGQMGLGIERDRYFKPKTFDECKQKENLMKADDIKLTPMTEEEEYRNAGITKEAATK